MVASTLTVKQLFLFNKFFYTKIGKIIAVLNDQLCKSALLNDSFVDRNNLFQLTIFKLN